MMLLTVFSNLIKVPEQEGCRIDKTMAKAGIAAGATDYFWKLTDPSMALSDGANMLQLNKLEGLLIKLKQLSKHYISLLNHVK